MSTSSRRSPRRRIPRARATAARSVAPAAAAPGTTPEAFLAGIPDGLRKPLLAAFHEITTNFAAHRWEPSELNGGKLCEAAYSILRGYVDGRWAAKPSKPRDFVTACRELEKQINLPQSVRITTPRVLMALYEIRNNRNVGHLGGDVDPNHMDATLVLAGAKWVVAELVRIFHGVSTEEATEVVEALVEREVPAVWSVGTTRRVLVPGMSMKDQTMLLLYDSKGWMSESELVAAVEHSNPSGYRRDVLIPAHKVRLIEYDKARRSALITPLGVDYVETQLKPYLGRGRGGCPDSHSSQGGGRGRPLGSARKG